jgi:LSD1 subclass zinc finger protein
MATILDCPACQRPIQVPEGSEGRAVRCPLCRHVIPAAVTSAQPAARSAVVPKTRQAEPEALDDLEVLDDGPEDQLEVLPADDEDRRRPRRDRDDRDERDDRDDRRRRRSRRDRDDDDDRDERPRWTGGMSPLSLRLRDLPDDVRREVNEEVSDREEIVWLGQPDRKLVMIRNIGGTIFGAIFSTVALVFLIIGIVTHFIPFAIFAFFFILIGLAVMCSPLLAAHWAKRTCYVLTTKRAIVIRATLFSGFDVRTYKPGRLRSSMYRQRSWFVPEGGDLVMEERLEFYAHSTGRGYSMGFRRVQYGFMRMHNVKEIEDLVHEVLLD